MATMPAIPVHPTAADNGRRWLCAGVLACAAGAALGAAAWRFVQSPEAPGFSSEEMIEIVHALVQVPVLIALVEAARRAGSAALRASSVLVYGSMWALTALGLVESESRPRPWEFILVVAAAGGAAAAGVEAVRSIRSHRPHGPAESVAPLTALPVDGTPTHPDGGTPPPPVLDYGPPPKRSYDWVIGVAMFAAYLLFKAAVRNSPVVWSATVFVLFSALMGVLAGAAVWSGMTRLRLRRTFGAAAAVSGALDLVMVLLAAATLGYGVWLATTGAAGDDPATEPAMRTPLAALVAAGVAWELAVAGLLAAALRHPTPARDAAVAVRASI